jgi:hypothetical protein
VNIFPIRTWRVRRRAAVQARDLIAQILDCQAKVDRCPIASREFKTEAKSAKLMLRAALRDLEKMGAFNESGMVALISRDSFLKCIEFATSLMRRESELLASIRSNAELVQTLLQSAGAIPLNQARRVQAQLIAIRDDFRQLQRKIPTRSQLIEKFKVVEKSRRTLEELQELIVESSAAATQAEEVFHLPMRTSREIRRKHELLTKYTAAVQTARDTGDAYVLRESWRQFKYLTEDLRNESEQSVSRAVRELEMWLKYPELTPELSTLFAAKWRSLLERSAGPMFLEDWAELKKMLGHHVRQGFEDRWKDITKKFRKNGDVEKLSWDQVLLAASQIRKRGMPPLYRD